MIKNLNLYYSDIEKTLKDFDFSKLKNKSILITGANGLIGSAIIDVLNNLNINNQFNIKIFASVRNRNKVLDRFSNYENLKIIEQDVTQKINIEENIDYIIHAASNSHPNAFAKDPVGTMLGNFIGIKNILDFAKTHNTIRVEYISSGEIYGQGAENIKSFAEDYSGKIDSTNPRSCYPLSKVASETLCVSYTSQYGLETVIARPCHTSGPTQTDSDSRAISQFIRNVVNDENIVLKSEGGQVRSYCHSLDCVTGILTILLSGKSANAYNISNPNSITSIKETAEIIAKISNKKVVFDLPTEMEKRGYNPVTRSVLDSKKLVDLGWNAYWDIQEGIKETIKVMM